MIEIALATFVTAHAWREVSLAHIPRLGQSIHGIDIRSDIGVLIMILSSYINVKKVTEVFFLYSTASSLLLWVKKRQHYSCLQNLIAALPDFMKHLLRSLKNCSEKIIGISLCGISRAAPQINANSMPDLSK